MQNTLTNKYTDRNSDKYIEKKKILGACNLYNSSQARAV